MRPALEELRQRLANNKYEESIIDSVIKQIEPFVGYGLIKKLGPFVSRDTSNNSEYAGTP